MRTNRKDLTRVKTADNRVMRVLAAIMGFVAAVSLARALAANAWAGKGDDDVDETYARDTKTDGESDGGDYGRIDVRLTRPGEAESRLDEGGFAQVPGAERITKPQMHEDSLRVPASQGRGVAAAFDDFNKGDQDLIVPKRPNGTNRAIASAGGKPAQAAPTPISNTAPGQDGGVTANPVFNSSDTYNKVGEEPRPVKQGAYQEVSVIVSDHGYFPSRIFVTQDIPVKMYLTTPSKSTLCFMVDTWGVKKGVVPNKVEEVNFTPDRAGNYRFYCPVKGIEGIMTVREAPRPQEERAPASAKGAATTEAQAQADERVITPKKVAGFNEPKNAASLRAVVDEEN